MKKRVVVTGGSGLLGRAVMEEFMLAGNVCTGTCFQNPRPHCVPMDLRSERACMDLIQSTKPDVLIHCAATRDPDACEQDPQAAYDLNVTPLALFCEILPPQSKLIFISSDYVFDGEHPPYSETSQRNPINVYGETKVKGEDLTLSRGGSVVRVPLLIGSGSTWEDCGFVYQMTQLIQARNPVGLDDLGVRFPTWTEDVARMLLWMVRDEIEGVVHLRSPRGKTKFGWALELADLLGMPADHIQPLREGASYAARRPANCHLSLDRLEYEGYNDIQDFRSAAEEILREHGQL